MSKPLFADNWYGKLPADEVRKEVQGMHDAIGTLFASLTWGSITGKPSVFPPDAHTHTEADITDLGDYLPLAGGTVTGALTVSSGGATIVNPSAEQLQARWHTSGNRAQLLASSASNESYLRNALSDGTVDGSIIIDGANDKLIFRPGDTSGTLHEVWHNGNMPVEEGTYTPTIGGTTDPTVTYSAQLGRYRRIGNIVVVHARVAWSAMSGGSGSIRVSLPFTVQGGGVNYPQPLMTQSVIWATVGTYDQITALTISGASYASVLATRDNDSWASAEIGDLGASGEMRLTATYHLN